MGRLLEEFNVRLKDNNVEVNDYNLFQDKKLLDSFRVKILERLSDKGFINKTVPKSVINDLIDEVTYGYDLTMGERTSLFNLIDGEVNGFGPITYLMKDDNITEIMVNSPSEIYIEIDGLVKRESSISFVNNEHIIRTIDRLIEPTGKTIDINKPMVDARLADGSRINAVIPPLSAYPVITIRKFRKNIVDMNNLIGNGSLTPYMARFLEACVKSKLNILVSGGASAGKTTLLNILGNYIDNEERIITIEDVRELNLPQEHVVSLETKISNYDGVGEITVRDLVRNSLRMRPDRIIIGEVRGSEAFDMLQAMNTGHEGSLTSLHANGCKDAISRLETMVLMDGIDIPVNALREYINDAIDIVVHITRLKDGRRKITEISELVGVKDNEVILKNIFKFNNEGLSDSGTIVGEFVLQEYIPEVLSKIKNTGNNDLNDMFIFKKNKKNK
jgi:pilus assembly protein CpaF